MSLLALTDAQISTWVASFMLPLFRVGALLTTMPIIGTTLVPKRIKLFLSLAITLAILPSLPPLPAVNPLDLSGLMLIAEQIIIGIRNIDIADPDYHPWPESAFSNPSTADWNDLTKYAGIDHVGGDSEDWFRERLTLKPWNNGSNFAFTDGHAKFFIWESTLKGQLPGMHNVDRVVEKVL